VELWVIADAILRVERKQSIQRALLDIAASFTHSRERQCNKVLTRGSIQKVRV